MQTPKPMRSHRRLTLVLAVFALLVTGTVFGLAPVVRRIAIARIGALFERPVAIETVALDLLSGRITVGGVRIAEPDGRAPFVSIERLEAHLRLPSLLLGHLSIRDLVVDGSSIRVVRLSDGRFNFSDLLERPAAPTTRALDVTVDRFRLDGGTVTLEDRALPEPRTWASEQITIEAYDVSTRRADGRASARSVTAGAPLSVEIHDLRLHPVHLVATVTAEGVDLSPLRLYSPPDAAIVVTRGRANSAVTIALDAKEGLRVDATGRLEDLALGRAGGGESLALIPAVDVKVEGFGAREGTLRLDRLAVDGTLRVQDAAPRLRGGLSPSRVHASVSDLTWPATTAGRLEVLTGVPGGGALALAGMLRPPPEASELRLRLDDANLTPWAELLPVPLRVAGVARADLRVKQPLGPGVAAHVQGAIAVDRLAVGDGRRDVATVRRVEATGLELDWPDRVLVARLLVSGPRGTIERDRAGVISTVDLPFAPAATGSEQRSGPSSIPRVEVREVAVRDGQLTWRDQAVTPSLALVVSGLEATVTNVGWPTRGPLGVRAAMRPPGGGHLRLAGEVGVDPVAVDLRVAGADADLASYQPYVPTAARIGGRAALDLAVSIPTVSERRATVRGSATLSRVDVRDGARTVARAERVSATGVDLDWPGRLTIARLALGQPWVLVDRDATGGLPLRRLLALPATDRRPASSEGSATPTDGSTPLAVAVGQISIDGGGARIVDQAVSPPFAVDVDSVTAQIDGLSTGTTVPARVQVRGRVGAAAELTLRGTVRAFGAPLRVDADGELQQFAVPRANPYLVRHVGWHTQDGRLTTKLHCRVEGDALSAHTDVRLSRLQLARAGSHDEVQARIGLPLSLLAALLKDRRGDIALSFQVGGRLGDPRFDFRDAVWSAIRTVSVNALTLPVSWIGRVHFTPDSRIERIQVDPVTFEPGTAALTEESVGQVNRLGAFLDRMPQVTLRLGPVLSAADADALRSQALGRELDRVEQRGSLSREDAAARVFAERFPGEPVPATPEATLAALRERTQLPADAMASLAKERLDAVRTGARRAGIDVSRLIDVAAAERPDSPAGQVDVQVGEPDRQGRSPLHEVLRRLRAPFAGAETRP